MTSTLLRDHAPVTDRRDAPTGQATSRRGSGRFAPRMSSIHQRARRLAGWFVRRSVGLVALALLAGFASTAAAASSRVEILVDGEVVGLRTYAATVGDVIERMPIEIGTYDDVRPGLNAPVDDGMRIDVARAVAVDVHVDGELVERVVAPVGSVAGVLTFAGLEDVRAVDAQVIPAWTAPVSDGDEVHVWVPNDVTVIVDGQTTDVTTFVSDVESLLIEQDIELGPDDIISHNLGSELGTVDRIAIARVTTEEVIEEVELEHGEVVRDSTEIPAGQRRVETEGSDGLRLDTYQVVIVDGDVVERELVTQEVVTEPVDRVVVRGIFEVRTSGGMVDADDPVWDQLARCEARGNWGAVSANGLYMGGLQFHASTWRAVGGTGLPHEHPREVQIEMGRRLQARSGWGQWPHCASQLGLR